MWKTKGKGCARNESRRWKHSGGRKSTDDDDNDYENFNKLQKSATVAQGDVERSNGGCGGGSLGGERWRRVLRFVGGKGGVANAVGGYVAGDTKTNVKHTQKCIGAQIAMKSKIKQGAVRQRERERASE